MRYLWESGKIPDYPALPGDTETGVLVIGGGMDNVLGGDVSREIAAQIPGAQLRMYDQLSHGLYEEAGDFNQTVLDFLCAF